MFADAGRAQRARFGPFELDLATGELFKGASRLRLQEQPRLILAALLKHPGELVTREDLHRVVWGEDIHVDYDHALNMSVAKIRRALSDSPERPKYIETIPKKGYRFVAPVEFEAKEPYGSATADQNFDGKRVDAEPRVEEAGFPKADGSDSEPAQLALQASTAQLRERRLRRQRALFAIVAAGALFALAVRERLPPRSDSAPAPVARFSFTPPSLSVRTNGRAAISPNGRHIVYISGGSDSRLWVRDLDSLDVRPLAGTEAARRPFWSPNSEFIAFAAHYEMKKISFRGGLVSTVCELPNGRFGGGAWSPFDSTIVFSAGHPTTLYSVPAPGGVPKPFLAPISTEKGSLNVSPSFLPEDSGRRALLLEVGEGQEWDLFVADLNTGQTRLLGPGRFPVYSSSHILYQPDRDDGGVWALPFFPRDLTVTGAAVPVAPSAINPTVDRNGTLVVSDAPPKQSMSLVWRDRSGNSRGVAGRPQPRIANPVVSPDGRYVAVLGRQQGASEIWLHAALRPVTLRMTYSLGHHDDPVWFPTNTELVYRRSFQGLYEIYKRPLDSRVEPARIASSTMQEVPTSWSNDGKRLVFTVNDPSSRRDIWYMQFPGGVTPPTRHKFLGTRADEILPNLSPDGRWLAYCSDVTGAYEVYMKPFPEGGDTVEVSVHGGCQPGWAPDGRELYYVQKNALMAVSVRRAGGQIVLGTPTPLFRSEDLVPEGTDDHMYDVAPDGSRFVLVEHTVRVSTKPAVHVIQNWASATSSSATR